MDRADITKKVIDLVCETLECDPADVQEDTAFEDLGADSFDLLELVTAMEDEFHAELDDESLKSIKTVKDAVDAIESVQ